MFTLLCGVSEGCMKAFSSSPLKLTNSSYLMTISTRKIYLKFLKFHKEVKAVYVPVEILQVSNYEYIQFYFFYANS